MTTPATWCEHYNAARCRSCSRLEIPYAAQLADKEGAARAVLGSAVPDGAWLPAVASAERGFRNRAKLVVGGTPGAVTLGILDGRRRGVDLRDCGLYEPALAAALPVVGDWLDTLRLLPYDVTRARGELKHVHVTVSPDARLMVRVVLRSTRQAARVRAALPDLRAALPGLRVATINYLPAHVALLEGAQEEVLTPQRRLPMDLGRLTLHLGPRSFFQTNTALAVGLYEQARAWVAEVSPRSLLDLYCGIGGFGLFAATLPTPPRVHGIEVSAEAVASARHTASVNGLTGVRFTDGDATGALADAECVVVNPPRRGIGAGLAAAIEAGPATTLVYSSCHPVSLAADLAAMPSFTVTAARLFDMFPHTTHAEVLLLAHRPSNLC